jgi:thiol-disulfide isomerase/thioredoxin
MAPAESWKDAAHQVVEFRDGDVNADGVPATRQRFYFGPDESMREVNEQLSGKFVADAEFRNVIKNAPMSEADFTYAPPATAQDATPPKPQMLANGSVAPDFTVQDLAGRPLKLSDFRGKIVVLDFWSTNCGPCIESRDHLNAVAGKFGDDVVFLAVDVWDKKADIDAWLPKHPQYDKLRFAIDPRPAGSDSATLYQAPGVPALFVIGRDGKTTYSLLGWDGPNSDLETAVKRAGGTAR